MPFFGLVIFVVAMIYFIGEFGNPTLINVSKEEEEKAERFVIGIMNLCAAVTVLIAAIFCLLLGFGIVTEEFNLLRLGMFCFFLVIGGYSLYFIISSKKKE